MTTKKSKLNGRQRGAALVEYALLVGLIALIAAAAIPTLEQKVAGSLDSTSCYLNPATSGIDGECSGAGGNTTGD